MEPYEIHIPRGQGPTAIERVHGDNWLDALRRGLTAAGLPAPTRNLSFQLEEDQSVVVTDHGAGQTFRVIPIADHEPRRRHGAMDSGSPVEAVAGPDALADPFAEEDALTAEGGGRGQEMHPGASHRSRPRPPPHHPLERELESLATGGVDIPGACAFVLDTARAHITCVAGSVLLIDSRDRSLYFAVARGPKASLIRAQRLPLEVGLAGACIRTRRSMRVDDPANDPRFARSVADTVGYVPRNIVCAPVIAGRRVYGVMQLLDRTGRPTFDRADEQLARRAARRLGEHIEACSR